MPTISRSHLPPPKDWDEFEEMCADFFGAEWGDPSATRYGRQGQRQRREWECEAVFALALAHQSLGEDDRAIELLEQRVKLAIDLGREDDEATAYGCLGNIYSDHGQYALARDCHTKRLEMEREAQGLAGSARAMYELAQSPQELGWAIKRLEAALQILEAIESPEALQVREDLRRWTAAQTPGA